jgi:ABC-type transport system involved in multi-copper enzyme maturation permease subunit
VNLAIAGVRKFWTRSATIVSLIIAVIIVALEFVLVGVGYRTTSGSSSGSNGLDTATLDWLLTFPSAFDAVLAIAFEFLGIVGLIYVATVSGSEWSWGTLKVAVARGQSRWQYAVATYASLSILLVIGLAITYLAGLVAVAIGASIAGVPLGNPLDAGAIGPTLVKFVRCAVALISLTSLGYAVAMVAKSQMAGIGTIIGYFIISILGPALLPSFVRDIFRYLPFSASSDAIGITGPASSGAGSAASALDPNVALLVTLAWLVGLVAAAAISVERTEITG